MHAFQAAGRVQVDGARVAGPDEAFITGRLGDRAEGVEQVQSQVVGRPGHAPRGPRRTGRQRLSAPGGQVVVLGQWKGTAEIRLRPALRFGEADFRRQPRHGRFAVRRTMRVQQHQAAAGERVMSGRGEDHLLRIGNPPGLEHAVRIDGVIPEDGLRVGAVRQGGPQAHIRHVVTIDIIPAGVQDPAVVVDAGRPLEHLERRDLPDVPAVGRHHVQRVHGDRPRRTAAAACSASLRGRGWSRRTKPGASTAACRPPSR